MLLLSLSFTHLVLLLSLSFTHLVLLMSLIKSTRCVNERETIRVKIYRVGQPCHNKWHHFQIHLRKHYLQILKRRNTIGQMGPDLLLEELVIYFQVRRLWFLFLLWTKIFRHARSINVTESMGISHLLRRSPWNVVSPQTFPSEIHPRRVDQERTVQSWPLRRVEHIDEPAERRLQIEYYRNQ